MPSTATHPAWFAELKQAISQRNEQRTELLLAQHRSSFTADLAGARAAVHALLVHACRLQDCPAGIKQKLFRILSPSAWHMLELAVELNEHEAAAYALRRGANPLQLRRPCTDEHMRKLLEQARCHALLYPGQSACVASASLLDQALREWRFSDASALLEQRIVGRTIASAWRDALRHGQLDIQRAILLLPSMATREFRLLENGQERSTDAGVRAVMKTKPHFPPKYGMPLSVNGQHELHCADWSMHRVRQRLAHPQAKAELGDVYKLSSRTRLLGGKYTEDFVPMTNGATETHLFFNRDFGEFIAGQFTAMAQHSLETRVVSFCSRGHVMNFALRIKSGVNSSVNSGAKSDSQAGNRASQRFVVKLDDPNDTNTQIRCAGPDLQTFAYQDLSAFLDRESMLSYYPEPTGVSVAFVQEPNSVPLERALANRLLSSCIPDEHIDGTVFWYLMECGFAGDIRRFKDTFARRPEAEQMATLTFDQGRDTALINAIDLGRDDAIAAFGELMALLPPQRYAQLLPPDMLHEAFETRHLPMIGASAKLLQLIPAHDWQLCHERILGRDTGHDMTLLANIMLNLEPKKITLYGELLALVPADARIELLYSADSKGNSALYHGARLGLAIQVQTCLRLLDTDLLAAPQRAQLRQQLAANLLKLPMDCLNDRSRGYADMAAGMCALLPLFSAEEKVQLLALAAGSALRTCISRNTPEAIASASSFLKLVQQLLPELRAQECSALLQQLRASHGVNAGGARVRMTYYIHVRQRFPEFHQAMQRTEALLDARAGRR